MFEALGNIRRTDFFEECAELAFVLTFAEVEDEFLTLTGVKFHERLGFKICGKFTDCGFKFNR